jgi:hypothetical protein
MGQGQHSALLSAQRSAIIPGGPPCTMLHHAMPCPSTALRLPIILSLLLVEP